jgi:long-chain acyl-CoA synthetase
MEDAGWMKRWTYRTFIEIARRHGKAILDRRDVPLHARVLHALDERLV